MEFLFDYLLFAAKLVTLVVLIVLPVILVVTVRNARRERDAVDIEVHKLNDSLRDKRLALESALLSPQEFKKRLKALKSARKAHRRLSVTDGAPRSFVIDFNGDMRASAVASLREEITAILAVARPAIDEIIVVLESGGGTMHGYGLAASQLRRVREQGIRLCVVVDRIAASGGYMMACVADELIAAPFAIIGSIGVVAQLPNFNRLLKKHDIDFEQMTAGEFKRTLTLFGENTDRDREKFQSTIDDAHALFKDFIAAQRPGLALDRVATGEWWFATRALELGLIDRLATSDDVIGAAAIQRDVFRVHARRHRRLLARLTG